MVLSETRTSIETELDQIFRILSVEEIVKAIELTFYKQLKDKFKKLTSGHLIWVNQDSFDLAISKIGKLPFEKKSNIRFCEEKNELSFLIEEVVGLFSNLEILDLFDETMIQSNISHYSPRERDNSMWPEVVAQKYIDLSEVSAAIDAEENKEEEIKYIEISNDQELIDMLESFTRLGLFRPGYVTRKLAEAFMMYGVNLSVDTGLSKHKLDSLYKYVNAEHIAPAEVLRRNNLVYVFFMGKRVITEESTSINTVVDMVVGDIQMILDEGEFNYYMGLFHEGFKEDINESNTIKSLVKDTIGTLYDDYHISCQNGFIVCRCMKDDEFHEYVFLLSANATGTFVDTMKNLDVSEAYCLIPFCLVTKDGKTHMYKRGYIHNQSNLYGHAVKHSKRFDIKQTIQD